MRHHTLLNVLHWVNPVAPPIFAIRDAIWSGRAPHLWDVVYLVVAASRLARACSVWSSGRSTTGSRSSSEHRASVVDPRLARAAPRTPAGRRRRRAARARPRPAGPTGRAAAPRTPARGRCPACTARARAAAGAEARPPSRSSRRRPRSPRRAPPGRARSTPASARPTTAASPTALPPAGRRRRRSRSIGAAELREPGAILGNGVEREAVRPGRDRAAHRELDCRALARRELRRGRPQAVPHDRVVARVEPVVREEDALTPRDAARVLDLDLDSRDGARFRGGAGMVAKANSERSFRHGWLA